jgi:hypothetical protein
MKLTRTAGLAIWSMCVSSVGVPVCETSSFASPLASVFAVDAPRLIGIPGTFGTVTTVTVAGRIFNVVVAWADVRRWETETYSAFSA